jgi:hypothetical protein
MDTKFLLYFVVPLSLGIIITVAGAVLLFVESRKRSKDGEIDIADWLSTGGKVTSAKLGKRHDDDTYEPIIKYVYSVEGTEYHGSKVFPHQSHPLSKKETAQDIIDRYPANSYVSVRYNPEKPSDSALEATPHPMNYAVIAGWILSGFGITSCCFTSFMAFIIFGMGLSYR